MAVSDHSVDVDGLGDVWVGSGGAGGIKTVEPRRTLPLTRPLAFGFIKEPP
jgi:hypothetical protein